MKQFAGFPSRMQFTPLPKYFLSTLLPEIDDIAELKTTLHIFAIIYGKRGNIRFVTRRELQNNAGLRLSLKDTAKLPEPALHDALQAATQRGTIIHLPLDRDGTPEDVYFLNTDYNRQIIVKIQNGEIELTGFSNTEPIYTETEKQPDIFTLYEENIGMLTPMIADELRQAEQLYPEAWIRDAIKEAVSSNKRSWRYIARILERWSAEGRSSGAHRRHSEPQTDPDKYIKGKYGHIVRR